MADQFQIPQFNPPAASPPPIPEGLVQSHLAYQDKLAQTVPDLMNQYLQFYQNQQKLKAGAFEAGGPYLMNMLYGKNQPAQTPSIQPSSGGMTNPPTSGTPGGATPGNYGGQPQTTASTLQPGNTAGQLYNSPIEAAHNHPVLGQISQMIASQNQPPPQAGNPNLGIHAQKIQQIQAQMAQNSQMGAYGQKLNQGLQEQLNAEKALMEGEQFNVGQQRQQQQFEEGQAAEESRFQRGQQQKKAEAITSAVEKGNEPTANLKLIDDALGQLTSSLSKNKPTPLSNVRGQIAEVAGTATPYGIPLGSKSARDVNESAAAMRAALSTEITRTGRYTPFVDQILNAMVPTAKDQDYQDKIQRIKNFRNAVASGVNQNIDNAITSIMGGRPLVAPANNQGVPTNNQYPQVGEIRKGYRFKGGSYGDPNSWEKVVQR